MNARDQQTTMTRVRQTELSRTIMLAIGRHVEATHEIEFNDGDVFSALMYVLVELLAHTSSPNRDSALRLLGPEIARAVEQCSLHYARPRGAA